MAFDNTRGALYDSAADTTIKLRDAANQTHIISEDVSLKAGIIKASIPLVGSEGTIMSTVLGRVRVITVRGIKWGTQLEIEAFLKQFTDHVDVDGTQDAIRYYPLFHPDHTSGEGSQTQYYTCLINDFTHRAELIEAGFAVRYSLELFEGSVFF